MKDIKTYNVIAQEGLDELPADMYTVNKSTTARKIFRPAAAPLLRARPRRPRGKTRCTCGTRRRGSGRILVMIDNFFAVSHDEFSLLVPN